MSNHLEIVVLLFGHGDLDLDPTSLTIKPILYLIMLHMCTKSCLNQ